MKLTRICGRLGLVGLLCVVAACGGDGGGSSSPPDGPAQVSTLAYVVTRCHEEKGGGGWSANQALWVRQGDREPVKIREFVMGQPPIGGFCTLYGRGRNGANALFVGALQRLGVSPDGSLIVFEVTDDFSPFTDVVSSEQQGIFVVQADGSNSHPVAEPSNEPAFRIDWGCALAAARGCSLAFGIYPDFEFSRDGRRVVYTDLGLSDTGEEAPQVFTLDVTSNEHQQVTYLARLPECRGRSDDDPDCVAPYVQPLTNASFLGDTTIAYSRGGGANNLGGGIFTVMLDANGVPEEEPKAIQVVGAGGVVLPVLEITGAEAYATLAVVPGRTPVNGGGVVNEAFVVELPDGAQRLKTRVLQLTNFDRSDTNNPRITPDRQRVVFFASADPLGTNPSNQCQWFSIDRLGSDLRQLTSFRAGGDRGSNCLTALAGAPDCTVYGHSRVDLGTGAIVFSSDCDPLGTNPRGGNQLFALRTDGSGLRQLTYTQGMITNPDGSVDVELPSPFKSPAHLR